MSKLPRFHNKHIEKRKNSNSILAKSISSKVRFSNKTFFNVILRGSRLRSFSFKNIKIFLSDFSGVILNKNRLSIVHFKKCVFYASIFRDCRFKNCTLKKSIFINTNTESMNHAIQECYKKYSLYEMNIHDELKNILKEQKNIPILQTNR
ncbi:pentapeptide repeat-containing protein, partial [Acinetobacter baumannii]|uniref:pentapeptide repeat-containing protein n=1 Tax=Acinetobacter baumannii TaxID=470 RepID=UPI00098D03D7